MLTSPVSGTEKVLSVGREALSGAQDLDLARGSKL